MKRSLECIVALLCCLFLQQLGVVLYLVTQTRRNSLAITATCTQATVCLLIILFAVIPLWRKEE